MTYLSRPVDVLRVQDATEWGAFRGLSGWTEAWRVLSAQLLHLDVVHLACVGLALWGAGAAVERRIGSAGMLALFAATGAIGAASGSYAHPRLLYAGASTAAFGLLGAAVAFAAVQRRAEAWRSAWPVAAAWCGALALGIWASRGAFQVIDVGPVYIEMGDNAWVLGHAAHVAAFATGAVLTVTMRRRAVISVAVGAALAVGALWLSIHEDGRVRRLEETTFKLGRRTLSVLLGELDDVDRGVSQPDYAAGEIRRLVIEPWRAHRESLADDDAPADLLDLVDEMGEAFAIIAEGVETEDAAKVDRGMDDLHMLGVFRSRGQPWVQLYTACERDDLQACTRLRAMFGSRCNADEPEACWKLSAALLRLGEFEQARKVAERGVELGDSVSHGRLAAMLLRGWGGPHDLDRGRELAKRGCELGSGYACRVAADALTRGYGGPVNVEHARRLLERGCEAGDGASCKQLELYPAVGAQ